MKMCPVKDCAVLLRDGDVLCGGHWGLVPAELRAEIAEHHRRGRVKQFFVARAKAIASVRGVRVVGRAG